MSIRPVDMNGVIQRTQDVGTLKQHQDMKPMVDQQNIQIEVQREEYRQSEQVTRKGPPLLPVLGHEFLSV